MTGGWPVVLTEGPVRLRALRRSDEAAWMRLRAENAGWLEPWDATSPVPVEGRRPTFGQFVRTLDRQGRQGGSLPFAVEHEGALVGQLTVSGITYGSLYSASIGYWISRHVAGLGITPTAVALATDHCFGGLGLHRVEINIRPENGPSLRVVEKLGFRDDRADRRGGARRPARALAGDAPGRGWNHSSVIPRARHAGDPAGTRG
jgi:ribosomal-protein-alanine N-acetyltransferase